MEDGGTQGNTHTHAHADAHTHTCPLTHTCTQQWPVCVQAQRPPWWAVPGRGGIELGNDFLNGAPRLLGGPCCPLLIVCWENQQSLAPAKPSLGKGGHFDSQGKRALCVGNRDSPRAAETCQGRGCSRRPGGPPQRGGGFSLGCCLHLGSQRPATPTLSREQAPHGETLKS